MKKNTLEETIIDCKDCEQPTKHQYLGNYGVQWKPTHLYQCNKCGQRIHSPEKVRQSIE